MTKAAENLKWFVLERAVKSAPYQITAAFETSIAASNYAMFLRRAATNPEWDCFFVFHTDERFKRAA